MTINKDQLRNSFPNLTDEDLRQAENDQDAFVRTQAQRSGQTEDQVRQTVRAAGGQG